MLRCFQRLSVPHFAASCATGVTTGSQKFVHSGPLVLRTASFKYPAPTTDRDRTVSATVLNPTAYRFNWRTAKPFRNEYSPDVMSRHRGAKPPRRCGTLGEISLFIPRVALSVERRHFHSHTAGSLTPTFVTARPVRLAVRLAYAFTLKGMVSVHAERTFERLRYLFGGDRPSQTAHLTMSPDRFHGRRLEFQHFKSGIPKATPQKLTPLLLSLPTYSVHEISKSNIKLQ